MKRSVGDCHNGYFSKFQVYTGKDSVAEKGLGARVVTTCTSTIFFTSTELLTNLERDGIYSCGSPRKDRKGFPEALKKPKLSNTSVKVCV